MNGRSVAASAVFPGDGYIAGFNGIRAVAVGMVIAMHLGLYTNPRLLPWATFGDGVGIFFVLSGFLITGIMLKDERQSVLIFLARRMLRLYPALLLYVAGMVLFDQLGWATVPMTTTIMALTYTSNYASFAVISRESSHLWTLGVEEQFYLLWPVVMFYARRFAVAIAACATAAAWWYLVHPPTDPSRYVGRYFLPAAGSIFIGCLTAFIVCQRHRHTERIRRWASTRWALGLAAVLYFSARASPFPFGAAENAAIMFDAQRVGIALFLVWICTNQQSAVVRALEFSPVRYLGVISYGIYLWQGLFVRNGPSGPAGWFHRAPWNLLLTIGVAALSYELVERRFLRLKDRLPGGANTAKPVLAASSSDALTGGV